MALKAKFAGICARTGKSYRAGAQIEKGSRGWELVGGASSEIKLRNVATGNPMMVDPGKKPLLCGACIKADLSYDTTKCGQFDYRPDVQLQREGDAFVCPTCKVTKAVVVDSSADNRIPAGIRLVRDNYGLISLSHRVPAQVWEKIKAYFVYWSADDLDDMDYFDMSGGYYLMPERAATTEPLNGAPAAGTSSIEAVEAILEVAEENRLEHKLRKLAKQQEEALALAQEKALEEAKVKAENEVKDAEFEAQSGVRGMESTWIWPQHDAPWEFVAPSWSTATATLDGQIATIYRTHEPRGYTTKEKFFAPRATMHALLRAAFESAAKVNSHVSTARRVLWEADWAPLLEIDGAARFVEMAKASVWFISGTDCNWKKHQEAAAQFEIPFVVLTHLDLKYEEKEMWSAALIVKGLLPQSGQQYARHQHHGALMQGSDGEFYAWSSQGYVQFAPLTVEELKAGRDARARDKAELEAACAKSEARRAQNPNAYWQNEDWDGG